MNPEEKLSKSENGFTMADFREMLNKKLKERGRPHAKIASHQPNKNEVVKEYKIHFIKKKR